MVERLLGLDGLPSMRKLRLFALVVEHGSIGRAADEIGMTQPAASYAIARLESSLGNELVIRGSGGSRASRAGERLALRTARFLARLEQALLGAASSGCPGLLHRLRMVHVRAHIAVAETGNFTQAASALGISPPALHRAVRDLEQLLRRRLYRAGEDGVGVNAAGEVLAQQMRLGVQELLQAFEEIGHAQAKATAQVCVGVLPLMPKRLVARALVRTKATYPDARVTLRERDFSDLLKELRRADVDIIIGGLPGGYSLPEEIVHNPLFADPHVLVVRRGHPLTRTRSIEPSMLAKYEWIVPTENVPRRVAIEQFFATLPTRPRVWLNTTSPGMILAALGATDCITLLSRAYLLIGGPKDLSVLPMDVPHTGRVVGVYRRKDWLPTAVQQRFLDALSETSVQSSELPIEGPDPLLASLHRGAVARGPESLKRTSARGSISAPPGTM